MSCDFMHRKQSNARDIRVDLNGIFSIMPLYRDEYLYGDMKRMVGKSEKVHRANRKSNKGSGKLYVRFSMNEIIKRETG